METVEETFFFLEEPRLVFGEVSAVFDLRLGCLCREVEVVEAGGSIAVVDGDVVEDGTGPGPGGSGGGVDVLN